jgi:hypothetical protein
MFIDNKYKSWHDSIIEKAKKKEITGYFERHHIIPKCLGGHNKKDNIVKLTAKEHFIIHMLLCKFTKGNAYHKMLYAFQAMTKLKHSTHKRLYKITSRISEKLRIEAEKNNPVYKNYVKEKISKANKGFKHTKETKLKMSKSKIGNKNALGLRHSQDFINKIKKINTGNTNALGRKFINKNGITKMIKKENLDKYLKLGYKLGMDKNYITPEYRRKKSEIAKAYYRRVA